MNLSAINYLYSIPYLIVFTLIFTQSIVLYETNDLLIQKTQKLTQLLFVIIILGIFYGLRGFIFSDWASYYPFYEKCPSLFDGLEKITEYFKINEYGWEPLFLIYSITCKTISPNFYFFQFVSFMLDLSILYCFFKYYIPENICIGFLIFILFSGIIITTNTLRNSKSIMFFLISIRYIENKKFIKYCFCNILGALFHVSSIIYLPCYFLMTKRFNKYFILFLFVLGNIIFLFKIRWCTVIFSAIAEYIPLRLGNLLVIYLNTVYASAYGFTIGYFERTVTFILLFFLSNRLESKNKNAYVFINIYYLYILIYLFFSEFRILLERVAILFICSYWILLPRIYFILKKREKYFFLIVFYLYGMTKTSYGYRNIHALYENALLEHSTYAQRIPLFKKGLEADQ